MNSLRTLTIIFQTVLGMTATFDVTLYQRRWKAVLSLTYFFGGFVIHMVDVHYFQLSPDVVIASSNAAKSIKLLARVVAIGSGLAMMLYMMYHYSFIAMKHWRKQSLTLAEGMYTSLLQHTNTL